MTTCLILMALTAPPATPAQRVHFALVAGIPAPESGAAYHVPYLKTWLTSPVAIRRPAQAGSSAYVPQAPGEATTIQLNLVNVSELSVSLPEDWLSRYEVFVVGGDDVVPMENEEEMPNYVEYRRNWLKQRAVAARIEVVDADAVKEIPPRSGVGVRLRFTIASPGDYRIVALLSPPLGDAFSPGERRQGHISDILNISVSATDTASRVSRMEREIRQLLARDDEAAVRLADQALALDSDRAEIWVAKGFSLDRLGRRTEAREAFQRALALHREKRVGKPKPERQLWIERAVEAIDDDRPLPGPM